VIPAVAANYNEACLLGFLLLRAAGIAPKSTIEHITPQICGIGFGCQEGRPMPITPFLNGEKFDSETTRVMGVALEMACLAGDCADDVKQAIANKIIALAKAGARNPDALCGQVLKDIRTEPA
jgi:hypothetical protein